MTGLLEAAAKLEAHIHHDQYDGGCSLCEGGSDA